MIYIVEKHKRIHKFSVKPGDIEAKKKLERYRKQHWKITAVPGNEEESNPSPQAKEKKPQKKPEIVRRRKIMGIWTNIKR